MLFLIWAAVGVFVLWFDVAGTVPESGPEKLIPFAYRYGWYLSAVIALLYVVNLPPTQLPSRRISELLGLMFVFTAVGGLLGVLAPSLEFPSFLQLFMPTASPFIESLIAPRLSDVQGFLGYDVARPTAPFAFANAWGNNLVLFLPFFLLTWLRRDAGWRRLVAPIVLAAAVVPVVFSLNRGVWLGLGVLALYLLARWWLLGRHQLVATVMAVLVGLAFLLIATPLGATIVDRLETPHSNERRESVASTVIEATWKPCE
jgi:hypothetical protein